MDARSYAEGKYERLLASHFVPTKEWLPGKKLCLHCCQIGHLSFKCKSKDNWEAAAPIPVQQSVQPLLSGPEFALVTAIV